MIERNKPVTNRPGSYTAFTAPASFIAAAAQRATRDGAQHGKSSREASEVARWEGEGGAEKPRPRARRRSPKPL